MEEQALLGRFRVSAPMQSVLDVLDAVPREQLADGRMTTEPVRHDDVEGQLRQVLSGGARKTDEKKGIKENVFAKISHNKRFFYLAPQDT